MKTLNEISTLLNEFEKTYGLRVNGAQQGSDAWFRAKLGVISSSNANKAVAKVDSDTRFTYMSQLVAQVCTGIAEEINSKHMDWGHQHEDASRSYYEFESGVTITQIPFVFMDNAFRVGCSPDGLVTAKKGVEIKCPYNSENYVKFLVEESIKPEWKWQYQFTLWALGAEQWDFCQYDPRMKIKPMKIVTVERDEKMQKTLADAIPQFISDMDDMLKEIGIGFGDHWKRLAKEESANILSAEGAPAL